MVAWSSFTAQNLDQGFLQFYATGEASIMYDKPIVNSGFASAQSSTAECKQTLTMSYNAASSNLDMSIALCDADSVPCKNPCPNILSPQGMGYDSLNSLDNYMDISLNMQAISTALAVNLGMIPLNHLVMIPGDNNRISLFDEMMQQGMMSASIANHTSSYFGKLVLKLYFLSCHHEYIYFIVFFSFFYKIL